MIMLLVQLAYIEVSLEDKKEGLIQEIFVDAKLNCIRHLTHYICIYVCLKCLVFEIHPADIKVFFILDP